MSLFKHGPFKNAVTLYGVAISVATILIVVYVPFLQVGESGWGDAARHRGASGHLHV